MRTKTYIGSTPDDDYTLPNDTSFPEYRDDDPQSGGSTGIVYNLDGPGIGNGPRNPIGTVLRKRANFIQWAEIDGNRVSQEMSWFSRISVRLTNMGDVIDYQVANDNTAGTGTTLLTWDLR